MRIIDIAYTVVSIGEKAMWCCKTLEEVVLPESITSIGEDAFYKSENLSTISMPNTVGTIGSMAFYGCKSLNQIDLPESITNIGASVFYGCSSLTQINIPAKVYQIAGAAFAGCTSLQRIMMSHRPPVCESNSFDDSRFSEAELVVPSSMYNAYLSSPIWMNFRNISTFDDSGASEIETCADPQVSFSDKTLSISCETPNAQIHYSYYLSNVGTVESGEQIPAVTKTTNAITVIAYATANDLCQSKTVIQTFPFDATAYDINGDNKITITDVTTLIDVIVNQ